MMRDVVCGVCFWSVFGVAFTVGRCSVMREKEPVIPDTNYYRYRHDDHHFHDVP